MYIRRPRLIYVFQTNVTVAVTGATLLHEQLHVQHVRRFTYIYRVERFLTIKAPVL